VIQRKGDDAEMCSDKFMRLLIEYLKKVGWTKEQIADLIEYVTQKE
jgi:hypothetical protein